MTRMNLSFAIFILANILISINSVLTKVFVPRDQLQINENDQEKRSSQGDEEISDSKLENDGYLLNRKRRNINDNSTLDESVTTDVTDTDNDRQQLIEVIMQRILDKLNMTRIPDMSTINSTVAERRQAIRLYKTSLEELQQNTQSSSVFVEDESVFANQFHSFTDNGERPALENGPVWAQTVTNTKKVYFSVNIPEPSDARQETVVKSAKLKVYKRSVHPDNLIPSNTIDRSVRIDIYQTIRNPDSNLGITESRWLRKAIDSNLVSLETETGWEEFDVAMAVQDWIREPETNFGLEIVCDSRYVMDQLISFVTWDESDNSSHVTNRADLVPVLNVLTQSRSILRPHRSERSVVSSNPQEDCTSAQDTLCCRDHITVSFSEINWTMWIIEPLEFNFYFCRNGGRCPAGHRVANQYSRLKSDHISTHPGSPFSVVCTETSLSSLIIAHFTENNIWSVKVINDMFAAQCMCS